MCRPDEREGGEVAIEDLLAAKLPAEDAVALERCFDDEMRSVLPGELRSQVRERLLPLIRRLLRWETSATCRKVRANDARSVSIRYNSDFHRDRHIFGTSPQGSELRKRVALSNLSAVVYLDPAAFEYVKGSSYAHQKPEDHSKIKRSFDAGTMIIFPSSLTHRACEDEALQTRRRTIILFDIEKEYVDEADRIPHVVICMPFFAQVLRCLSLTLDPALALKLGMLRALGSCRSSTTSMARN